MKTLVITKMVGQTGLRPVGSIVNIDNMTAENWIKNGWAVEKIEKQEKQTFETKEHKTKRKTKHANI